VVFGETINLEQPPNWVLKKPMHIRLNHSASTHRTELMVKLKTYGINGHMFDWIKEFLSERTMGVGAELSSVHAIENGTPKVPCYHQFSFCAW